MTLLITCWTRRERWTASGSTGRIWAAARRGIVLLLLHAVLRAGLLAVAHTGGVERAADDLVADARQVLDAAATDEDDRVLLKVVPLTGDVGGDLDATGDAHAGDLAQRRVRLLRRRGVDAGADTPPLPVTGVTKNPTSGNATSVTATYTVAAPGGSWDASDDGTYAITINAGEV